MKESSVSIRGRILREIVALVNSQGTLSNRFRSSGIVGSNDMRKGMLETKWKCPEEYTLEEISMEQFEMYWLEKKQEQKNPYAILQLHGGGYVGSLRNIYYSTALLYSEAGKGASVLTIDYRVAPEDPYPAALEDAMASYEWLLEQGYDESHIIVAGDSAGGGLALALCLKLKDQQRKLPLGVISMSAWTDLTVSGSSYDDNFEIDPVFGKSREGLLYSGDYFRGNDPTNPYVSPMFGDFTGFPPMLMQVGDCEMLLSDTLAVAEKAKKQGVKVRLSVYKGMFHVFQLAMLLLPESRKAWVEVEKFLEHIKAGS